MDVRKVVLWLSKRDMPEELKRKLEKKYAPAEIVVRKVTAKDMVHATDYADFREDFFLW